MGNMTKPADLVSALLIADHARPGPGPTHRHGRELFSEQSDCITRSDFVTTMAWDRGWVSTRKSRAPNMRGDHYVATHHGSS